MSAVRYGRIVKLYANYGFVQADEIALGDLFFHRSFLKSPDASVTEGARVEFKPAPGRNGTFRAMSVRVVESEG